MNKQYLSILLWLVTSVVLAKTPNELAEVLLSAEKNYSLIPRLSEQAPLTIETAYQVQRAYIEQKLRQDKIAGFKAGLTSKMAQLWLGSKGPVSGVLLASSILPNPSIIELKKFRSLVIETEIGLILAEPIQKPLNNIEELYQKIQSVVPVIELPEFGFEAARKIKATDTIAANVAAAKIIVGQARQKQKDLKNIQATLFFGDKVKAVVSQGFGASVLGDPLQSALWLVNVVLAQGWPIEKGSILLTGTIGERTIAKPGLYKANFGELGEINFEVK